MKELLEYAQDLIDEADYLEEDTFVSFQESVRNSIQADKLREIASDLKKIAEKG